MLTDKACKAAACPQDKPRQRYTDSEGLYLEVAATGSKRWFWKFYYGGKEKRLAIGLYPDKETATAHGFRAMARTLMVKRLGMNPEVVEAQLARGEAGPLGSAYDRADDLAQRRDMMIAWADYLDRLKVPAELDSKSQTKRRRSASKDPPTQD